MKTWAKQLEDALPKAASCVIGILHTYCPNYLFGVDAPQSRCPNVDSYDEKVCLSCWESCDSKCRYGCEQNAE